MADFLGDYSDSEVDVESQVSDSDVSESSESSNNSGCQKWLKTEDQLDEAEDGEGKVKHQSKRQKAFSQLIGYSDSVEFTDDPQVYHKSLSDALDFLEKQWWPKYHVIPVQLTESFNTVKAAEADFAAASKQDDDNDEEAGREERAQRKKDAKYWTQVRKLIETAQKFFEGKKTDEEEDEEEEESASESDDDAETLTEPQLAAKLEAEFNNTQVQPRIARRWQKNAMELKKPYLVLLASVKLCGSYIDNAPQTGMLPKNWENATAALISALDIAESNAGIAISEIGEFKIAARHVSLPGGWLMRARQLSSAIVTMYAFKPEYTIDLTLVRLEAEATVMFARCLQYYRAKKQKIGMARSASALLDLLHVRSQEAHAHINRAVRPVDILAMDIKPAVEELYRIIDECSNQYEDKLAAMLARVYNICLDTTDRFIEARDMLLREAISPEALKQQSKSIQVRYNRTIAQLAFAAFRHGHFDASHNLLGDLCSHNWNQIRELLGQRDLVKPRNARAESRRKAAEILEERERLVPAHHAIPVTLLEQGYLILSTLQDLLHETKNPEDRQGRSKQFHNLCKRIENAAFSGPPGCDEEYIYAAYIALQAGDVNSALTNVRLLSGWQQLPAGSPTFELLEYKLRVDGLKVFLISLGQHYKSLTLHELTVRFGLPTEVIRATFSRLLLDHALIGFWNDDDKHVVIERGPQTKLHFQARECSDRLSEFIQVNDNGGRMDRRSGGRGRGRGGRGRGGR